MKKILFFVSLLLILFTSCQVTENITLTDEVNTSSGEIEIYDFFIAVIDDFSEFLDSSSSSESIMDSAVRDFANGLSSNENNSNVLYTIEEGNRYTLSFDFDDITEALSALGGSGFSVLKGDENSLSFYLDINNYAQLKEMIPFLSDPNFEVYGPEYNQGMSEEEYLEMISFLLGEEGPDAISHGLVSMEITVPGTITAVKNAEKTGDRTAVFSFPIISFLLLNEPLSFSIEWE